MFLVSKYFSEQRRSALIIRFWRLVLKNQTSYPFLSGDAFANLSDYSAFGKDGSEPMNVAKLRQAKVLFVPGHKLNELLSNFFQDIHASVLICGNSDENFVEDPNLPETIKLWLCQNYAVENGIGSVLPIGLENLRLGKSGFRRYQKPYLGEKITSRVLIPPMTITNPIRQQILQEARNFPHYFDIYEHYLSTKNYFELIGKYKWVLVLEGNGYDTHRLWEVMYKGNCPVVLNSRWSRSLAKAGFPVTIIEDLSEDSLRVFEFEAIDGFKRAQYQSKLFMDYWDRLISAYI